MEKITPFYILPFIAILKIENTLTKEAKNTFNIKWGTYYEISFGWIFWDKSYKLIFKKN